MSRFFFSLGRRRHAQLFKVIYFLFRIGPGVGAGVWVDQESGFGTRVGVGIVPPRLSTPALWNMLPWLIWNFLVRKRPVVGSVWSVILYGSEFANSVGARVNFPKIERTKSEEKENVGNLCILGTASAKRFPLDDLGISSSGFQKLFDLKSLKINRCVFMYTHDFFLFLWQFITSFHFSSSELDAHSMHNIIS